MDNTYTDGWIGIDEAAKYMDVTKDTVRNWIKKTDIPVSYTHLTLPTKLEV